VPQHLRRIVIGASSSRAHGTVDRIDAIEPDEFASFPLHIGHTAARERLQRAAKPPARPRRILRHTALLAAVIREEHHDAIGLAIAVRSQDNGVGHVGAH